MPVCSNLNPSFTKQFYNELHHFSLYSHVFQLFKCLLSFDFVICFLDMKEDCCCFLISPEPIEILVVIFDIASNVLLCFLKPNCVPFFFILLFKVPAQSLFYHSFKYFSENVCQICYTYLAIFSASLVVVFLSFWDEQYPFQMLYSVVL